MFFKGDIQLENLTLRFLGKNVTFYSNNAFRTFVCTSLLHLLGSDAILRCHTAAHMHILRCH